METNPGLTASVRSLDTATIKSFPCTLAAFEGLSAEILKRGKSLRFTAHGSSMIPLVRDGDILLIDPVDPNFLHAGDVVLCQLEPGRVVVHRVISVKRTRDGLDVLIQGDHSSKPDGKINQNQVYGKLVSIDRDGERIAMETPAMRIMSLVAALRLQWRLDRYWLTRSAGMALKHLPVFYRFF